MREAIKSAARPVGVGATACQIPRRNPRSLQSYCKSSSAEFSNPPIIPPGGLRIPPVWTQEAHKIRLECDQNFDHFSEPIFDRFWVVLGRHLGVIFGTLGAQVGLVTAMLSKNVIFEKTSAALGGSTILTPKTAQDEAKIAPRSP